MGGGVLIACGISDFKKIIPNYCLYEDLNFLSVIALVYILVLYLLILIALFYFVASLYNRGIQPLLYMCRPTAVWPNFE